MHDLKYNMFEKGGFSLLFFRYMCMCTCEACKRRTCAASVGFCVLGVSLCFLNAAEGGEADQ